MSADAVQSPINAVPFGLLDLLSGKVLGRNPNELLQAVRATVDLQHMWAQGAAVNVAITGGIVAVLGAITAQGFVVPAGKVWVPVSFSTIGTSNGVGDIVRISGAIVGPGASAPLYEMGPQPFIGSASGTAGSVTAWNFLEHPVRAWGEGTVFCPWVHQMTIVTTGGTLANTFRYLEF